MILIKDSIKHPPTPSAENPLNIPPNLSTPGVFSYARGPKKASRMAPPNALKTTSVE